MFCCLLIIPVSCKSMCILFTLIWSLLLILADFGPYLRWFWRSWYSVTLTRHTWTETWWLLSTLWCSRFVFSPHQFWSLFSLLVTDPFVTRCVLNHWHYQMLLPACCQLLFCIIVGGWLANVCLQQASSGCTSFHLWADANKSNRLNYLIDKICWVGSKKWTDLWNADFIRK